MVMNFVSYKLHKLFACLCFQVFLVCSNHFPQFTQLSLGRFKSLKDGVYCTFSEEILQKEGLNFF
jgi:hypothetical protein